MYYNRLVNTKIYPIDDYLEFYSTFIGVNDRYLLTDMQFQIDRFDWNYNQIYFNRDSTNNVFRYDFDLSLNKKDRKRLEKGVEDI